MWLARRGGAKTLFFTWQNLQRHYPPPFSWIERYVLQRADAAIAGNTEAAQVLQAKGYGGPVHVIPQFGVDPELYHPDAPARTESFTIGYVGGPTSWLSTARWPSMRRGPRATCRLT
jgi:hypothetical protein